GVEIFFTLPGSPFNDFYRDGVKVDQFLVNLLGSALPGGGPSAYFYSFCTDLYHGGPQTFSVKPNANPIAPGLTNNVGRIGWLYNTFGQQALSPTDAAGLQLALWELIYDVNPDLNAGNFSLRPGFNTTPDAVASVAAANSYLTQSAGKDQRGIFLNVGAT